jgi:hypothetical protein
LARFIISMLMFASGGGAGMVLAIMILSTRPTTEVLELSQEVVLFGGLGAWGCAFLAGAIEFVTSTPIPPSAPQPKSESPESWGSPRHGF